MSGKVSSKDKANPCAICGWAQHMAIHRPMIDGPRKGEPLDHAYVPESIMRNTMNKPEPGASVFARAAWFLADYAELWFDMGPHEGESEMRENFARCMEKIDLARRLREMDGPPPMQRLLASMIKDTPAVPVFLKGRG